MPDAPDIKNYYHHVTPQNLEAKAVICDDTGCRYCELKIGDNYSLTFFTDDKETPREIAIALREAFDAAINGEAQS